ncbi:MAG: hypothetical protein IPO22_14545 [Anaerolineales bacterium]|nr:hypothetical protein [Anaerolineales bacterium]
MPVDAVVYTTVLTLAVFLILRIPFIWQGWIFGKQYKKQSACGRRCNHHAGLMTLYPYTMAPPTPGAVSIMQTLTRP